MSQKAKVEAFKGIVKRAELNECNIRLVSEDILIMTLHTHR